MEFLFEVLLPLVELISELIFAFGWENVADSLETRLKPNPLLAAIGYLLLGLTLGSLSVLVFPHPFSKHEWISILSLFLNPILFGTLSAYYGNRKRKTGRTTTNLATFWGGALFAFGLSAARLALILR